jgi:hypothetical protein
MPNYPTCVFCGKNDSKPSKEHIIPQWLSRLFPNVMWDIEDRETKKTFQSKGRIELVTKKPCKRCNSEWLEQIESAAKPILLPLIDGSQSTLNPDEQMIIALWFFTRAVMFDLHGEKKRPCYFEPYEHRALMESKSVDMRYGFYLARYGGTKPSIVQEDHLGISFTDADDPRKQSPYPIIRAYTYTFVVKHLALQIFCVKRPIDHPMAYYMPDFTTAYVQLFSDRTISWPPPHFFDDVGIEHFIFRWRKMFLPPSIG